MQKTTKVLRKPYAGKIVLSFSFMISHTGRNEITIRRTVMIKENPIALINNLGFNGIRSSYFNSMRSPVTM